MTNDVAELTPFLTKGELAKLDRLLSEPYPALYDYVKVAWPLLEPGREFIDNWHIGCLCEHLEACTDLEIRNLVINMPPRCMKSLLVSVLWMTWAWTFDPASRWVYNSYGEVISVRDSLKCRRVIQSPWYRALYGSRFQLTGDQNAKLRFDNNKTGFRMASTVAGVNTGEGGDYIVADDPHKVLEAESDAERQEVRDWWFETMPTRFNDPERVRKVIVMQRVHDGDLTGEVLSADLGYEHLCFPMRHEPARIVSDGGKRTRDSIVPTSLQLTRPELCDPRVDEGELLWPDRLTENAVQELEKSLMVYGTAGQLQQRPAPRGGGFFKRQWFKPVEAMPSENLVRVRYWDKAGAEEGKGDFTVGVLMARNLETNRFYVENVVRGQWAAAERNEIIKQTAALDRQKYGDVRIYIEQPPGLAKESTEEVIRQLAGFPAYADPVTRDKPGRAEPFKAQAQAGNVYILLDEWTEDYLKELERFPNAKNDDQVDGSSGAFNSIVVWKQPNQWGAGGA